MRIHAWLASGITDCGHCSRALFERAGAAVSARLSERCGLRLPWQYGSVRLCLLTVAGGRSRVLTVVVQPRSDGENGKRTKSDPLFSNFITAGCTCGRPAFIHSLLGWACCTPSFRPHSDKTDISLAPLRGAFACTFSREPSTWRVASARP